MLRKTIRLKDLISKNTRMKKIVQCLLAVLLLCSCSPRTYAFSPAQQFFDTASVTEFANVGVLVVDLTTGDTVDSYRAKNLLPTASTMKTISTATALELLGGDWRWSTFVETDAKVEDGVLKGNLYVRGTGDPTLGSADIGDALFLNKWVEAIRSAGIRKIEGSVVADMSVFDNTEASNPGWTWDDMGNYYGMGVFSINYKDNTMTYVLKSSAAGTLSEVLSTNPVVTGVDFECHARCANITYDGVYVHGVALSSTRMLTGKLPANKGTFNVHGDIPNPGLLLAQDFTQALRKAGVEVTMDESFMLEADAPTKRTVLYEHKSPALRDVVYLTNIHSNNLFAESIFRTLGCQKGVPSTLSQSCEVVSECWQQRGVDMSSIIQWDGSGLAPQNAVSPATFVALMTYMYQSPHFADFYKSLPVSGKTGTGRYFLAKTALDGRVAAKSGTISGLKSYTGYIDMPDGHVWAFSIVVNNGQGGSSSTRKCIENYLLQLTQ